MRAKISIHRGVVPGDIFLGDLIAGLILAVGKIHENVWMEGAAGEFLERIAFDPFALRAAELLRFDDTDDEREGLDAVQSRVEGQKHHEVLD